MVQVLPSRHAPSRSERMGRALAGATEKALDLYAQEEENKALEKKGVNLRGIRDPEARSQIMAQELAYNKKAAQAKQGLGIDYFPGNKESSIPDVKQTKQALPEFGEVGGRKTSKTPQSISPTQEQGMGSAPQRETEGVKRPILAPDQLMDQARQVTELSLGTANPLTLEQSYALISDKNEDNKRYNAAVDADLAKRIESQDRYGNIAVETLQKSFENPTAEQEAIFRKKGEDYSRLGESEAGIRKKLAVDVRKFKNTIANVKESIGPKRLVSGVVSKVLGTDREAEKEKTGLRIKLKPILDEGLYDTARNLLSELGYQPEERESIITDLPEGTNKIMAAFPNLNEKRGVDLSKFKPSYTGIATGLLSKRPYTVDEIGLINNTVQDVFKADPSTNLVLFRKAMEDKGADWESFKDALDKGILEGTIKLNDDQFSQLDLMDNPPLNLLEKIVHGIKLIGR